MKTAPALVVGTLLSLGSLLAQDQQAEHAPAKELKRFERLIGTWSGKGTVRMGNGQPEVAWTCQSTYAWTLGNHFVGVDSLIDFGSAMPPLAFRELLGWDAENQRYVAITIGNTGEGTLNEITWPDDSTMVQIAAKKQEGEPLAERTTTTITADGMTFRMLTIHAGGEPMEHVTGTFQRADKPKPVAVEATAAMVPPTDEMQKLARAAGTYKVAGDMVMAPGTPAMQITGTDVYKPIFGGTVLQAITKGEAVGMPGTYESEGYMVWNESKKCFDSFGADNMGFVGTMENRFTEDGKAIVATQACTYMKTPMAQRMVIELDDRGRFSTMTAMALLGTNEPYCSFKASYTPEKAAR